MMRNLSKTAALLVAALALSGCGQQFWDMAGDWFSTTQSSNLRGMRVSLAGTDESLQVDPALAATPVLLPAPFRNADWPQPGGYSSNAMHHLEAPGPLRQVWSRSAGKGNDDASVVTASPVVAAGRIYVLDSEAHVYVLRLADGRPVWDKRLTPKDGTDWPTLWGLLGKRNTFDPPAGMGGGVAFNDGKLYVTSGWGFLVCMDAATGRELWRRDFGIPIVNAPVVTGGRIFVTTTDNHFYALAENDGRSLWENQAITESANLLTSTSAAVAGDVVVAPFSSGELNAYRVQNGQNMWSDVLSRSGTVTQLSEIDAIAGRPVIDRDMVFAMSQSGVVVGIHLSTGDRAWSKQVGGIQTPWVAGDYVYVITNNAELLCLTRKEGKVRWVHQLPQYGDPDNKRYPIIWSGPVLVSNRLVMVSNDGYAQAFSPYTGKFLARMELPDGANIAPVVANGIMYLYTNDAEIVALR
ncbi:MAG TPA: PQQ-binding-like beta-propeller repeat protein [Rhizomicrobium sp.]|nr:PQQ-binding-like beta-propeller repeat protein [Rhizomicrobium sp.]